MNGRNGSQRISTTNIYNFHCIQRKEQQKISNAISLQEQCICKNILLTGERLNSDPEMITGFSFLLDGKIMKAIHHTRESRPAHILCLVFHGQHYHIDQYFTHQFVSGSSALFLLMQSVCCTLHFNHFVMIRLNMLLLVVSH